MIEKEEAMERAQATAGSTWKTTKKKLADPPGRSPSIAARSSQSKKKAVVVSGGASKTTSSTATPKMKQTKTLQTTDRKSPHRSFILSSGLSSDEEGAEQRLPCKGYRAALKVKYHQFEYLTACVIIQVPCILSFCCCNDDNYDY